MSLFSIASISAGLSLEGSYRGIPFTYDTAEQNDEVGRRTRQTLFPGQDIQLHQDLVAAHRVAGLLGPLRHRGFGDGLTERGGHDVGHGR